MRGEIYGDGVTTTRSESAATQSAEHADVKAAQLIRAFKSGDSTAFGALYTRYFDQVYAYLKVILRDSHEAEDLTQQVFIQVFEALPAYEERGIPFRSWLITVVRNRALKHIRKQSRIEIETSEAIARRNERRNGGTVGQDVDSIEVPSLGWLSDRDLLVLVEHLPLAQRQVLVLRFLLDLSPTEVARILARSPNQVRVLQHRALLFLKKRLTSLGKEPKKPDRDRTGLRRITKQATVVRSRRNALAP